MSRIAALALVLAVPLVNAQQANNSTGDYATDLGHVYGAMQALRYGKEICSEFFPNYNRANEVAYTQWRKQYLSFIQEIQKRMVDLIASDSDPASQLRSKKAFDEHMAGLKNGMREEARSDMGTFEKYCRLYPKYLAHRKQDLERYYSEQVIVIRKGFAK